MSVIGGCRLLLIMQREAQSTECAWCRD
ncbi:MAG TPA: hypothetical protein DD803_17770 [Alcaligenes faecalis]|nr:hypothetical protein [Alcaligenes faecalis]